MNKTQQIFYWSSLAVFSLLAGFFGLKSYPLLNGMEAVSAQMAREMYLTQDFWVPMFNFTPHFDTPPLISWLQTASIAAFGETTFAVRFLSGCGLVAFVGITLYGLYALGQKRAAYYAPWVLLSMPVWIFIARLATGDIILASLFTLSSLFLLRYLETNSNRDYLFAALALGFVVLAKGLSAFVVFSVIMALTIHQAHRIKQPRPSLFKLHPIMLFLAVALVWWVILAIVYPDMRQLYFDHNLFFRSLGLMRLSGDETMTIPYALFLAIGGFFPWSFALVVKGYCDWKGATRLSLLHRYAWITIAVVSACLILLPIKLSGVMLLLAFPVAMLISDFVVNDDPERVRRTLTAMYYLYMVLMLIVAISFLAIIYKHDFEFTKLEHTVVLLVAILSVYACIGTAALWLKKKSLLVPFALVAGLLLPLLTLKIVMVDEVREYYSEYDLGEWLNTHFPDTRYFIYKDTHPLSSVIFYTHEYAGVILPRESLHPQREKTASQYNIPKFTPDEFRAYASDNAVLVVVVNNEASIDFHRAMLPIDFCELYRDGQALLLTNETLWCRQQDEINYPSSKNKRVYR